MLENCTYLEDEFTEVYGYKVFGSPYQLPHLDSAFQRSEKYLRTKIWPKIPDDTEILITHGPPYGHGDIVRSGKHVGSVSLTETVLKRVKPIVHVFGHIHESYGVSEENGIIFINAASCNKFYKPVNLPFVFDLPKKINN